MENVSTPKSDAWFSTKTRYPADSAICIFINTFLQNVRVVLQVSSLLCLFSCLRNTLGIQTRQALCLSIESLARMSTWELLLAIGVLHILALLLQADVAKRILVLVFFCLIGKLGTAESTFPCFSMSFIFCTILPSMIRLHSTSSAEILITLSAFDSMLGHMNSCLWRYCLTLIVLGSVVNLARLDFHHVPTWASDQIIVSLYELFQLRLIDLLEFFLRQIVFQLLLL